MLSKLTAISAKFVSLTITIYLIYVCMTLYVLSHIILCCYHDRIHWDSEGCYRDNC